MYSFAPIPAINTINDHSGFYLICVICVALILFAFVVSDYMEDFRGPFIFSLVVMVIAAGISFNTGEYREYTNTKVTGTLVKFEAEGFRERSGKYMAERHYTYVVYNINGNEILFRAHTGTEYPKTAIFYKN
jgi:uncharacterized membrane protein YoaK (UPF0700 family)